METTSNCNGPRSSCDAQWCWITAAPPLPRYFPLFSEIVRAVGCLSPPCLLRGGIVNIVASSWGSLGAKKSSFFISHLLVLWFSSTRSWYPQSVTLLTFPKHDTELPFVSSSSPSCLVHHATCHREALRTPIIALFAEWRGLEAVEFLFFLGVSIQGFSWYAQYWAMSGLWMPDVRVFDLIKRLLNF